MNKHIYLHKNSNNPMNHKSALFISMFYRGICLNDSSKDFHDFKIRFINRMIRRGYHPALIRKTLKTKNITNYKYRQKYLENSSKRLLSKRAQKILKFEPFAHQNKFDKDELDDINNRILMILNESETKTIYFIKTYQRLFDNDKLFKSILANILINYYPQN